LLLIHTELSSALIIGTSKDGKSKISKIASKALTELEAANTEFCLNCEGILPAEFLKHFLEPLCKNSFCVELNLDGVIFSFFHSPEFDHHVSEHLEHAMNVYATRSRVMYIEQTLSGVIIKL
jgi:hypothetical protein